MFCGLANIFALVFKTKSRHFIAFATAGASHNGNAHGLQNGQYANNSMVNQPISVVPLSTAGPTAVLPGPATNLNIGMDYWGGATSSAIPAMRGQVSPPITGGTVSAGARDNVQSQLWLQVLCRCLSRAYCT